MTSVRLPLPVGLPRTAVAPSTVYCKVDDSSGPITPGDRLIPSTTTFGHAMRAAYTGKDSAVIGEALAPFAGGCGLIPVAVSAGQLAAMRKQAAKRNPRRNPIHKFFKHC